MYRSGVCCAVVVNMMLSAWTTSEASAFVQVSPPGRHPLFGAATHSGTKTRHGFRALRRRRSPCIDTAAPATSSPRMETPLGGATTGTTSECSGTIGSGAAAPAVSYRRLRDTVFDLLETKLQLEAYPIPPGLKGNSAVIGRGEKAQSVETEITAWRAPKIRQIRTALVETSGPTQVLNFVIFPDPRHDLPIFGADLVSLPGVHLVCIDLQPAHAAQKLPEKSSEILADIQKRHVEALPWGGDLPEAARRFFSPHCIWSKLDPGQEVEGKALEAMMDYLREYLRLVANAEPEDGDGALAKLTEGQADYCEYRRVNDPARGMLTRFYGAEWTEAAIEGILFDFKPVA